MPVHNRFFLTKQGQLNPQILIQIGPLLGVEISIPTVLAGVLTAQKHPLPQPKTGYALIDTGATKSGVDESVIKALGIQPVGVGTTLTAGGPKQQSLYPAHFRFPGEGLEIDFSSVLGVNLHG